MTINYHDLKMSGLKKAAGETIHYTRRGYIQINYDMAAGEVITAWHADENSWTRYHDNNIIYVCSAHMPMSMQEIAYAIANAVQEHKQREDARKTW